MLRDARLQVNECNWDFSPTIDLATVPNRVHERNSIVASFLCSGTTVLMVD